MNIFEFVLTIAIIALAIIIIVLVTTKKGRMFAKAAIGSLFTEANKNPKIVAEYFEEKIGRLQKTYGQVDDAYRKASGELISSKNKIETLQEELERANKKIIEAKKRGDDGAARMFAREAVSIKEKLAAIQGTIPDLENAVKSAQDLREKAADAIEEMKSRKEADIAKVKAGKAVQEIYDQFDASKVSSDIDKILNQFSDYADEQEKMGIGARAAWETSAEAQKISAEKRAKEYEADDYIASIVESMSNQN